MRTSQSVFTFLPPRFSICWLNGWLCCSAHTQQVVDPSITHTIGQAVFLDVTVRQWSTTAHKAGLEHATNTHRGWLVDTWRTEANKTWNLRTLTGSLKGKFSFETILLLLLLLSCCVSAQDKEEVKGPKGVFAQLGVESRSRAFPLRRLLCLSHGFLTWASF